MATSLTYDTDQCATPATLGYDVVVLKDGKAHRLGTYASPKIAHATKDQVQGMAGEDEGTYSVISRF